MSELSSQDVGELTYREVQHELKLRGQPAKGPDKLLRERLMDALDGKTNSGLEQPEVEVKSETIRKTSQKVKSPKVEVQIKTIKPAGSPSKSPASPQSPKSRRKSGGRAQKAQVEAEAQEKDEEGKLEQPRQSRRKESVQKADNRSPSAGRRRSKASLSKSEDPVTPLDKIKRIARRSTAEFRKSMGQLDKEMKRRRIPWKWILPALLVAILLLGRWRETMYWHRHLGEQMASLGSGLTALREQAAYQAERVGHNAQDAYEYLYRQTSRNADRVYGGLTSSYRKALSNLPIHHKLPEGACSAKLDGQEMEKLLSVPPTLFGIRMTLADVWKGHKEDPLKATGVLLAGRNQEHLDWAAQIIQSAVPPECQQCYLHIKGKDYAQSSLSAAGQLQAILSGHIASCPYAVIHIQDVHKIHSDNISVLVNLLSEQGSFMSSGKQVATNNALIIGSTQVPGSIISKTENEEEFAAAVKRDLAFQLEMTTDPTRLAVPEAFRRRWDYVAPVLKAVA